MTTGQGKGQVAHHGRKCSVRCVGRVAIYAHVGACARERPPRSLGTECCAWRDRASWSCTHAHATDTLRRTSASYLVSSFSISGWRLNGFHGGEKRLTGLPSRSHRNLVQFHLIELPRTSLSFDLKNLKTWAARVRQRVRSQLVQSSNGGAVGRPSRRCRRVVRTGEDPRGRRWRR